MIRQIHGDWNTRDMKLRLYHAYLELLVTRFDDLTYTHLPIARKQFADVIATMASIIDIPKDVTVHPLLVDTRDVPTYFCLIDESVFDDSLPLYYDINQFLRFKTYPKTTRAKDRMALR